MHQRVFKNHAPPRLFDVVAAGGKHVVHAVFARDRHQLSAHLVIGRVQRQRQRHRQILFRKAAHVFHQAAGRERHTAHADAQAALYPQNPKEFHHVVVVIQRFAAAHQHDVADLLALRRQYAVGADNLPQHLRRGQAARAAVQRGSAERAPHAAAHLGGQAERVAVFVAHQHAFDDVAVRQAVKQFDRAVELRFNRLQHGNRVRHAVFIQRFAKRLGQVAHLLKVRALMQPRKHLPGAEGGLAQLFEINRQLVRRHAQQLRLVHPAHHAFTLRMRQT